MSDKPSSLTETAKAHGPNWVKWLGHLVGKPDVHGLEIGTWKGESTEFFLDEVFIHPESTMTTVDHFRGSAEHHLAGIDVSAHEHQARARLERFGYRAHVLVGHTMNVLRKLFLECRVFDFVYVDASHDAMNVLRDAVLAFDLLKVGGIMVFDDLEWKVMEQEVDRPKIAIDAFVACYGRSVEVIAKGWQLALRRVA